MLDVTRHDWHAAQACKVAGLDTTLVRMWRKREGLRIGKFTSAGEHRYSALDVAELTAVPALQALGFTVAAAIEIARKYLRPELKSVLINRLIHGFWSIGAFELDHASGFGKHVIYLDQIAERTIVGLALALPVNPLPKAEVAERMMDAILDYAFSAPGFERWRKWRISVIERGGTIPFPQAAAELGVPEWFLRCVLRAKPQHDLIAIVKPHAPKVRAQLEGVTLQ
jgi:hypothetical protein